MINLIFKKNIHKYKKQILIYIDLYYINNKNKKLYIYILYILFIKKK